MSENYRFLSDFTLGNLPNINPKPSNLI